MAKRFLDWIGPWSDRIGTMHLLWTGALSVASGLGVFWRANVDGLAPSVQVALGLFAVASVLVIGVVLLGLLARRKTTPPPPAKQLPPMTLVRNQHFKGRILPLDNHEYLDCTFENCTLNYDGMGPWKITRPKVLGASVGISTQSPPIEAALALGQYVGLLIKPDREGALRSPGSPQAQPQQPPG